jgi:hypothetical protein
MYLLMVDNWLEFADTSPPESFIEKYVPLQDLFFDGTALSNNTCGPKIKETRRYRCGLTFIGHPNTL